MAKWGLGLSKSTRISGALLIIQDWGNCFDAGKGKDLLGEWLWGLMQGHSLE